MTKRQISSRKRIATSFFVLTTILTATIAVTEVSQAKSHHNEQTAFQENEPLLSSCEFKDESNTCCLVVPAVEDVLEFGYPVNENGETYGPDVQDLDIKEPDLLLATGTAGEDGYIRMSEITPNYRTPEEALANNNRQYEVNLYLQDGKTIIGQFHIGG